MNSPVCTLFEGSYHKGVAVLANSLYANGWRGTLFVGYRGSLPPWAEGKLDARNGLEFAPGASLRFRKLDTSTHFTNFKPQFLKQVISELPTPPDAIFYMDPDIVVKCEWEFFEEWVGYGVALCEDINSPLSINHPRRAHWTKFFGERGIQLRHVNDMYVNGGFVGLNRPHFSFCDMWERLLNMEGEVLGGLQGGNVGERKIILPHFLKLSSPFSQMDQDALNATCMAAGLPVSIMSKSSMDFAPGGWTLSHAIGTDKPWLKNFLVEALRGSQPSPSDKAFWRYSSGPIKFATESERAIARWTIYMAVGIGRFYRRS